MYSYLYNWMGWLGWTYVRMEWLDSWYI